MDGNNRFYCAAIDGRRLESQMKIIEESQHAGRRAIGGEQTKPRQEQGRIQAAIRFRSKIFN